MAIPVFNPTIRRKEMDAVLSCLVSDRIGPGNLSQDLLEKISFHVPNQGGVCFREPQRALECTLLTLIPERSGKVLLSALAPAYYVDVIKLIGLEPLLCDVDAKSGVMSLQGLEKELEDCKVIIVDYPLGNFPDHQFLSELQIPIIEEISTAVGVRINDLDFIPGTLGQYVILNMEEHHLITAGGGAIVVAHKRSDVNKLKKSYDLMDPSVLLPDMNAALAIIQSKTLSTRIEKRAVYSKIFMQQLCKAKKNSLSFNGGMDQFYYSFPVVIEVGMKDVIAYSKKKGVETEFAFKHVALDRVDKEEHHYPNALSLKLKTLIFPLYSLLGSSNVELISRVLLTLP